MLTLVIWENLLNYIILITNFEKITARELRRATSLADSSIVGREMVLIFAGRIGVSFLAISCEVLSNLI